ncbi:pseudouridine synthase [Kocuria sp. CPCC 205235]|uniref:pseudouridine synthase n=1 Tax=Kocuria sp. CPCC 205235 TaxID=3073549 RepID=UPI0034D5425E
MRKRRTAPPLPMDRGVGPTRVRMPGPGAPDPVLVSLGSLPATAVSYVTQRFPDSAEWFADEVTAGHVRSDDGAVVTPSSPYVPGASVWFHRPIPDDDAAPVTLDVLYEDEWIIAVDKPHGLCSTPKGENVRRSAVVAGRVQFANDEISALHRLDRSTGGVLLLCKRREDRGAFHKMFEERSVSKTYWAVASLNDRVGAEPVRVESRINKTQGELQAREDPGEVNAITDIRLLTSFSDTAGEWGLYEVRPLTGRTHQIRVHMTSLGLPLRGDKLYPVPREDFDVEDPDNPMQLIARSMTFVHPMTGEPVTINSRLTPSSHAAVVG